MSINIKSIVLISFQSLTEQGLRMNRTPVFGTSTFLNDIQINNQTDLPRPIPINYRVSSDVFAYPLLILVSADTGPVMPYADLGRP